jgi:RNA polymerase-binding transcription factor DksA
MSASPLTEAQCAELERRLERELAALGGEIASEREEVREAVESRQGAVQDRGEESFAGSIAAVDRAVLRQHESARREVQAALARVRDGTYGECVSCGGHIGYERLNVTPAARRCMRCQELAERE